MISNKQNILVITPVLLKIARHGACKDFAFLICLTWSVWRIRGSRKGIKELRHRIPTIRLVPHRGEWSRSADTISWLSPFLPVSTMLRIPWDSSALEPLLKCPLFSAWYSWHVIYVYAGIKTLGSMCCFIWLSSLSSILGRKLNFRIPQSPIFNILSFSPFQFLVAASAHTLFLRKGWPLFSCLSANCHERIHSRQTNVKGSRSFQSSQVSDDQKVKLPPNVLSWFGFPGIEVTTWIKELIGRDPADQGFEQEILWIDEGENWEYGWRELKERFKFNNNRLDCHCFAVYCQEQEICAKKGPGCGGTTCGSRARQKPSRRNP